MISARRGIPIDAKAPQGDVKEETPQMIQLYPGDNSEQAYELMQKKLLEERLVASLEHLKFKTKT